MQRGVVERWHLGDEAMGVLQEDPGTHPALVQGDAVGWDHRVLSCPGASAPAEGREGDGQRCNSTPQTSRTHASCSPFSWGQDQHRFHSSFFLSSQPGRRFLMQRVDVGLKELLAPSPALPRGLPKFFTACFPSPIRKENVQGARPDTGRGNGGLPQHPRQIMPLVTQATHSHHRFQADNGVISPSLEHNRATPQPHRQPLRPAPSSHTSTLPRGIKRGV